jgi:hypothetical protein
MNQTIFALLLILGFGTSCAPEGSSDPQPARKTAPQDKSKDGNNDPIPPTGSSASALKGDAKCWKKMLDTPEYLACKSAGKIYNRMKKECVELGMKLTNDCSQVPAGDIVARKDLILKKLPDAYITTDQCGTYTLENKSYVFAYVMGQKFTEAKTKPPESASYAIHVSSICYAPGAPKSDRSVCDHESLKISNPAPVKSEDLGNCE